MWYEDPKWRNRLRAEQAVMQSRFPAFRLIRTSGGQLRWIGLLEPVDGAAFVVSIRYPSHFPYQAPSFVVEEPRLRSGAPHRYLDGSLCVSKKRWDPLTGTAASCVPLVSAWLVGYLNWCASGERF